MKIKVELEIENIRMSAVALTKEIIDFQNDYDVDMRKEIIEYMKEKLEVE